MTFKPVGGKSRNYINTETGEIISRRQYDKLRGIFYEAKAKANREADITAALARPAKGRKKAQSDFEKQIRVEAEKIRLQQVEEEKAKKKLLKAVGSANRKVKPKKIRKELLKAGHRAERLRFSTYDELKNYVAQIKSNVLPNGRRLVSSYAIGIMGYDEREDPPREIGAHLTSLQGPSVLPTESELREMTDDFLQSRSYFVFTHYFIHLHFDKQYAEEKFKKKEAKKAAELRKNIPAEYRKKGRK